MLLKTFVLPFFLAFVHHIAAWNYKLGDALGPKNWSVEYSTCKGERQSPVNIKISTCVKKDLGELTFNENYSNDTANQYKLKNMNKTLKVEFNGEVKVKIMSGGGLPASYELLGFHMHWGKTDSEGSEHSLDDKFYAMEIHLVHKAIDQVKDGDQFAALGIFVKEGEANSHLEPIVKRLDKVPYNGNMTLLDEKFDPTKMFPENRKDFFRYDGGLTTPNCDEHVVWTIFKDHITMSSDQLKKFRSMYFNAKGEKDEKMEGNHRPLQNLGSRQIYKSFNSSATLTTSLLVLLGAVLAHIF